MDIFESLLTVLDSLLAFFVFFPAVCFYWRGSWDLIGYYVLPGKVPLNYFVHAGIGCCTFFNYLIIPLVDRRLPRDRKVLYFIVTRALLTWHGVQYMFLWRGCWMLFDHYIPRTWTWALLALILDLLVMSVLRVGRATMWPPFMVTVDTSPSVLVADNRFKVPPSKPFLYALDSFFSAIVVNGMAIFSWRCVWCVWDALLFPDDPLMSDVVNFAAGTLGTSLLLVLQRPLGSVSRHLEKNSRLHAKYAWEGTVYLFVFAILSSLWRGGWNLNLRYLISDPFVGGWVHHCCGAVLFLLLQTYSLVGGWGVGEDGMESDGGAFFPVKYLRICFEDKLRRRKELLEGKTDMKDLQGGVTEPLNDRNSLVLGDQMTEEGADGYISAPDYFVNRSIPRTYKYDSGTKQLYEDYNGIGETNQEIQNDPKNSLLPSAPRPRYSHLQFEDPWEERPKPQKHAQDQNLQNEQTIKKKNKYFC